MRERTVISCHLIRLAWEERSHPNHSCLVSFVRAYQERTIRVSYATLAKKRIANIWLWPTLGASEIRIKGVNSYLLLIKVYMVNISKVSIIDILAKIIIFRYNKNYQIYKWKKRKEDFYQLERSMLHLALKSGSL